MVLEESSGSKHPRVKGCEECYDKYLSITKRKNICLIQKTFTVYLVLWV